MQISDFALESEACEFIGAIDDQRVDASDDGGFDVEANVQSLAHVRFLVEGGDAVLRLCFGAELGRCGPLGLALGVLLHFGLDGSQSYAGDE